MQTGPFLPCARRDTAWYLAFTVITSVSTLAAVGLPASAEPVSEAQGADARSSPTPLSVRSYTFTIPAEPLVTALADFTRVTGIRIVVEPRLTEKCTSVGITGTYVPDEALRHIIGDASIKPRFVDARTIMLEPNELRTIAIVSKSAGPPYRIEQPALGKYTQSLIDTPQTITEISSQVLKDQNVTTLRDALRNVSGISLAAGEGGSQGDSLTIRGFDAKDDFYLDGQRDFGNYYRDPFNLDRVEVIDGPSSMLLGHGEGGGIVNQVSKTPKFGSFGEGSLSVGTDETKRLTVDDNIELTPTSAFRLNAMEETAHVAGRDDTVSNHIGLAPSITLGLGTPTRATFSLFYMDDDDIPDYGLPYINDRPAQVPRSNYYGFTTDRLEDNIEIGTIALDHDFNKNLTLHSQTRYASYERSFGAANAVTPTPQPALGTSPIDITVGRTQHSRNGNETFLQNQTYVVDHFKVGHIANTVMSGVELTRETSHEISNTLTGLPSTNLENPNENQPISFTSIAAKTDNHVTADTLGLFAADSIKLTPHWELDGGLRFDTFDAINNETVSGTSAVQDVRNLSGQGGVVYKPAKNGSVYFSYDNSFQPSADALSFTTAQIVAPAKNSTFELGTKWKALDDRILITSSIFNSIMYNAHITQPDGTVLPVGTERSNGFSLNVAGDLTSRWHAMGSYTLLETDVLQYVLSTQPGVVGTHIPNAPAGSASLWTTYDLTKKFQLGFGGSGVSQRQASIGVDTGTGQPILVPGYIRLDGSARYKLSQDTTLQINAYNLANKYYFDEIHPDHVVPGAARSLLASLNIKF
jgi:catecholate siderophore receptor